MGGMSDYHIRSLGDCRYPSPLRNFRPTITPHFVADSQRILLDDRVTELGAPANELPSLELTGPRAKAFFNPTPAGRYALNRMVDFILSAESSVRRPLQ